MPTAAVSVAGGAQNPLSSHVSPTLALPLNDQVGARRLVLESDLLERDDWREAFDTMRSRLQDRPVLLQSDLPTGMEAIPTLEDRGRDRPATDRDRRPPPPAEPDSLDGGTTGKLESLVHCDNTLIHAARRHAEATGYTENDVHIAVGTDGHASGSACRRSPSRFMGYFAEPWSADAITEDGFYRTGNLMVEDRPDT